MSDARAELQAIADGFDGKVEAVEDLRGDPAFVADRAVCHDFIARLKEAGYDLLVFITGVDNYLDEPRFEVTYRLRSMDKNQDVRVNAPVPGDGGSRGFEYLGYSLA